jgi:hypothetical protein
MPVIDLASGQVAVPAWLKATDVDPMAPSYATLSWMLPIRATMSRWRSCGLAFGQLT